VPLAPLAPFTAALVALGMAAILTFLAIAALKFLSNAPVIGGWIAGKALALEHAISNGLGQAFSGIDAFIGGCFHALARLIEHAGHAIAGASHAALEVAEALNPVSVAAHIAKAIAHEVRHAWRGIEHGVRSLTKELHGIEHGVRRLERDLTKGIGHDLRLHVRHLEHEVNHLRRRVIPSIRGDVATAEGEIGHLYDWAKGKASLLGVGTFGMAVAAVLSAVGLEWLACRNGAERVGRSNCNLWDDLGDVLGLLAAAELALNFETFVHDCQAATEATVGAVKDVAGL
jgi:hypothetical protein